MSLERMVMQAAGEVDAAGESKSAAPAVVAARARIIRHNFCHHLRFMRDALEIEDFGAAFKEVYPVVNRIEMAQEDDEEVGYASRAELEEVVATLAACVNAGVVDDADHENAARVLDKALA